MVFNSLSFVAFLAVVYLLFLVTPGKAKVGLLFLASFVFYSFTSFKACAVLMLVSLVCFYGGRTIYRLEGQPKKQQLSLTAFVGFLILLLCYFKYFGFVAEFLNRFIEGAKAGRPDWFTLFVPIGVSYYIFQGIGYMVDVHWGKPKEDNLLDFLLFMFFFPKVMMGPIERGDKLLPQIKRLSGFSFNYDFLREGLLLIGWGLFKKLVVAERLSLYVNEFYSNPSDYGGITAVTAAAFYAIQLYADFSGYTDMALGVSKLFHINLTQNFDRPFYATNIQDFWRRWHISFSSWISEYLFTPLRMKLRNWGKLGLTLCFFLTFALLGAWHGTGWTFIIFGVLHGAYMTVSTFTLKDRDNFWKKRGQLNAKWLIYSRRIVTFCLFAFSLIFFRSETATKAFQIIAGMCSSDAVIHSVNSALTGPELKITLAAIVLMEIGELALRSPRFSLPQLLQRPLWQRWAVYTTLIVGILCFGLFTNPQKFIYFAF